MEKEEPTFCCREQSTKEMLGSLVVTKVFLCDQVFSNCSRTLRVACLACSTYCAFGFHLIYLQSARGQVDVLVVHIPGI